MQTTAPQRSAAEAALQSIVHLCRWACSPLQGCHHTKHAAEELGGLELLCKAAGSEGSGGSGGSDGGGRSGQSLCAAAVAAAGFPQLQRSAAAIADLLAAAAVQRAARGMGWQLAAVTRLLLCMCGCSGPGPPDALAASSGTGGGGGHSSFPVTVACLHSRQGERPLKTRVDAPARLLAAVSVWFDDERDSLFAQLLKVEVRGGRGCVMTRGVES